jgi:methylated-DNA-[protein]-cysteine S-methyltransferase
MRLRRTEWLSVAPSRNEIKTTIVGKKRTAVSHPRKTNRRQMTPSAPLAHTSMPSPVGELQLLASDEGLAGVFWVDDLPGRVRLTLGQRNDNHPILRQARKELQEYFAGKRTRFDVPLDFYGTNFQRSVWNELLAIPFGETRTYGALAATLGDRKKMRAVGAANGKNPISIIAPCHRVIGSNGDLT